MEKFIARLGLTRHIVHRFEQEVNFWLQQDWKVVTSDISKHGLRIVCQALLGKDDPPHHTDCFS